VLDQQRAGVDLLAVVFGQARRQRRPDLLECAPQPADAPVGQVDEAGDGGVADVGLQPGRAGAFRDSGQQGTEPAGGGRRIGAGVPGGDGVQHVVAVTTGLD
jgi:hypothetical protein